MNLIKRAGVYRELAILTAMLILTALLSFPARAEEAESQHERVRVGFFAMDGYHMMDEDGNRSGYGYDFLRLMARYWDADYEYIGYDKSWEDMQRMLLDGEIDVLVCTTIIETGLDISNANTLIVDHADRFGLSQLHQLRGRVGRGRERAYAYFLYDPTKPMTQQSHDRLATIAQNTALGSGFDVAMKDLELRGTGNLLGDEQSGHIEGVGFDLYVRMVSEAVEQYKEPERKESVAVTIDLPIEASIPVDYIDSDKLRLEAYQKLASARTEDDLDELRDELTDRYGKPPVDFEALFDVARLRFKARKLGISEIIAQGRNVRVSKFEPRESVQMRMARIYKGIQYRPLTKTYLVPAPFAGSLGSKPMSSDEVVGWTSQLLDDLDWKPTPRQ